ncbi:MAG: hypothetical protein AB8G05_08275 [Oligoflexales bacterium]
MYRLVFPAMVTIFIHLMSVSSFAEDKVEGRFRGYLLPDKKELKIPLQLDFFKVSPESYSAILRMNLGDFNSHEYVSQYYKNVKCINNCREITLNSDDWDLSLFELELSHHILKGKFRSISGYEKGMVLLHRLAPESSEPIEETLNSFEDYAYLRDMPTFPLLSGQYEGDCLGKMKYLQIEASKWFSIVEPIQTPFYGYRFSGRVGSADGSCGDENCICIENTFVDGTFNPYTGLIKVTGNPNNVRLSLDYPFLDLEGCKLKKTVDLDIAHKSSDELRNNIVEKIEKWRNSNKHSENFIKDHIDGYYEGFLYHSQLNRYQFMDVSVESIRQATDSDHIHFYPSAWLHFDQPDVNRDFKISVPFRKFDYNPQVPYMIWDSGLDVLAKIEYWQKDLILGQWISRTFGVVGPFMLTRKGTQIPFLVEGPRLKSGLGSYRSGMWQYEIFGLEDRDPIDISIFFPVQLYGSAYMPGITEMKTIEAGVYDFYSGSIAFRLSDKRMVTGSIYADDVGLFWPSNSRWGVRMLPMRLENFKHLGQSDS